MNVTIPFVLLCAWGPAAIVVLPEPVPACTKTSLRVSWAFIASIWNSRGVCAHLNFSCIISVKFESSSSFKPTQPLDDGPSLFGLAGLTALLWELRGRTIAVDEEVD